MSATRRNGAVTRGTSGRVDRGALLFGDFLLGTQEKVTRHQVETMLKKLLNITF